MVGYNRVMSEFSAYLLHRLPTAVPPKLKIVEAPSGGLMVHFSSSPIFDVFVVSLKSSFYHFMIFLNENMTGCKEGLFLKIKKD
jgi:hypothetical protein